jgi:hypothetical protein
MGFNNHKKQHEGCEEDTEINPVTCCLPVDVQKDIAAVHETAVAMVTLLYMKKCPLP